MDTKDLVIAKDGKSLVTDILQRALDECSFNHETLIISKGIYLTGPLFIKSNTTLIIKEDALILGTTDESKFKLINTRVAGIDMEFYPAILNVIDANNVTIRGLGVIDGNGPYWYKKYWGEDTLGGMRKDYDQANLRWACDYDCLRPRNILVQNSSEITLCDFTSKDSGFWNVHILYSHNVHIDHIKINSGMKNSPSTDGIDIDSSYDVLIENVITHCNDDSICIKSGRDSDGIKKNIPSHDIVIKNCSLYEGFGLTLGSEVSGGIYNIFIENISFYNTDCGFRIKSSSQRKGYIKDVYIKHLNMVNVKYLFNIFVNWNPAYSKCELPSSYKGTLKEHYKKLIEPIEGKNTTICNIDINDVKSRYTKDYEGINRIFNLVGFNDSPLHKLNFENMDIKAKEYGVIENVTHMTISKSNIDYLVEIDENNNEYDNR